MPRVSANVVVREEAQTKPTDAIRRVLKSHGIRVRTSESTCSTRMVAELQGPEGDQEISWQTQKKDREVQEEKKEMMAFLWRHTHLGQKKSS